MTAATVLVVVKKNVVPGHRAQKEGLEKAVDQHERNAKQGNEEHMRTSAEPAKAAIMVLVVDTFFKFGQVIRSDTQLNVQAFLGKLASLYCPC